MSFDESFDKRSQDFLIGLAELTRATGVRLGGADGGVETPFLSEAEGADSDESGYVYDKHLNKIQWVHPGLPSFDELKDKVLTPLPWECSSKNFEELKYQVSGSRHYTEGQFVEDSVRVGNLYLSLIRVVANGLRSYTTSEKGSLLFSYLNFVAGDVEKAIRWMDIQVSYLTHLKNTADSKERS